MSKKKKNDKDSASVQIYSRVRKLMPWEKKKISVRIVNETTVQNKTTRQTAQYQFHNVFNMTKTNEDMYVKMCKPLIRKVLEGYNAVLIAYGQTGSGKTHTLVGKPEQNIKGVLPLSLEHFLNEKSVKSIKVSGVEAYGTHVSRIELYDLFNDINANHDWTVKKGNAAADPTKATKKQVKSLQDCWDKINVAHDASHFAPTGKNPESSRGHVAFVSQINQEVDGDTLTSYFVVVDLAGSEGESAFTPEFVRKVDPPTLMARRLEAGVINTGLSQLQVVFNELKVKGKLSKVKGNGLRRILHAYINTKCMISVCFTLSPAIQNAMSTASTLKFAVQAGMVKVKPVKAEKKINMKQLVDQLQKHVSEQDEIITNLNDQIGDFQDQLGDLELELDRAHKQIQSLIDNAEKNALNKETHEKAQATLHKLAPSIASVANMKGFLSRKESSMSSALMFNLRAYKSVHSNGGASYHNNEDEVDASCVASNISEAEVDAQIKRQMLKRQETNMDMNMLNRTIPVNTEDSTTNNNENDKNDKNDKKPTPNKSEKSEQSDMDINPDKYKLLQTKDDEVTSGDESELEDNTVSQIAESSSMIIATEEKTNETNDENNTSTHEHSGSIVLTSSTTMHIKSDSDLQIEDDEDDESELKQLAANAVFKPDFQSKINIFEGLVHKDTTGQHNTNTDDNNQDDNKNNENEDDGFGTGFDDLDGEDPMGMVFTHVDTSNMNREEVIDYCDELESKLIEERTLRSALQQSQQVIIDHLMETNEALLRWFQMKKIL